MMLTEYTICMLIISGSINKGGDFMKYYRFFSVLVLSMLIISSCSKKTTSGSATSSHNFIKLTNPASGESGVSQNDFFKWESDYTGKGNISYNIYLGKTANSLVMYANNITAESYPIKGITSGTVFYWKVGLVVDSKIKGYSETETFTTNYMPNGLYLISPVNETVDLPLSVDLQWSSPTDKDGDDITYSLYFGTAKNNLSKIADSITDNSYQLTELSPSTEYYWKIEATDGKSPVVKSDISSFITVDPPTGFYLTYPENNTTGAPINGRLSWNPGKMSDGSSVIYDVYLGESENSLVKVANNISENYYDYTDLELSTSYKWKVVAKYSIGGELTSETWQFVTNMVPGAFTLSSPSDGENGVSIIPTLKWNSSVDPDGDTVIYNVYFGSNRNSLTKIAQVAGKTVAFPGLLDKSSQYCWTVTAEDGKGGITETDTSCFQTGDFSIESDSIVSAGENTSYYIDLDGHLWSFGNNVSGEVGNGTTESTNKRVEIVNSDYAKWITVGAGYNHACAIDSNGALWCWGNNNGYGMLGTNSTAENILLPEKVTSPENARWVKVSAGLHHTCAINTNKDLYCFGKNEHYVVGQNSLNTVYSSPISITFTGKKWKELTSGEFFNCAIDTNNDMWCWGSGFTNFEQITNGDSTKWFSVSAGAQHACAIDTSGSLWCGGKNNFGQIGNGTGGDGTSNFDVDPTNPVKIYNPSGVKWVSVGASLNGTCAIDENKTLWCWGDGEWGTVGNGEKSIVNHPVKVKSDINFKYISGGLEHVCGIDDSLTSLFCWGRNNYGQLGIGKSDLSFNNRPSKLYSPDHSNLKSISQGMFHSCSVDDNNNIYCWGLNENSEFGTGTLFSGQSIDQPVSSETSGSFDSISSGYFYNCAVKNDGTLWCWGENWNGEFGNGTTISSNIPVKISTGHIWTKISAGGYHTCGVDDSGTLWCWGDNFSGQLGNGTNDNSLIPVKVQFPDNVTIQTVSAGGFHTCAVDYNNDLWCWGRNDYGQVGNDSTENVNVPVKIENTFPLPWIDISAGTFISCGIDTYGGLWCWGKNDKGQLGDIRFGEELHSPKQRVFHGIHIASVSAAEDHGCAIDISHSLICWGDNDYGQLGVGNEDEINMPVKVMNDNGTRWKSVSVGISRTCGIDSDGISWCWGANSIGGNDYYLLGDSSAFSMFPIEIEK